MAMAVRLLWSPVWSSVFGLCFVRLVRVSAWVLGPRLCRVSRKQGEMVQFPTGKVRYCPGDSGFPRLKSSYRAVLRCSGEKKRDSPLVCEIRVIQTLTHFCHTTKRASQRLTPHIKGEILLYHRSGWINPE